MNTASRKRSRDCEGAVEAATTSCGHRSVTVAAPKSLAWRWLKFNLVGGLGIAVQLGCLAALRHRMHYLGATALAVELAVLHNFAWHCRFTWRDRPGGGRERWRRLLRFHAGNGVLSIAGNVALMALLTGRLGLPVLPANAIAIALCSVANFAAAEWFVFRPAAGEHPDGLCFRTQQLRKIARF